MNFGICADLISNSEIQNTKNPENAGFLGTDRKSRIRIKLKREKTYSDKIPQNSLEYVRLGYH